MPQTKLCKCGQAVIEAVGGRNRLVTLDAEPVPDGPHFIVSGDPCSLISYGDGSKIAQRGRRDGHPRYREHICHRQEAHNHRESVGP